MTFLLLLILSLCSSAVLFQQFLVHQDSVAHSSHDARGESRLDSDKSKRWPTGMLVTM